MKTEINSGQNCDSGKFLTWNASLNAFGCAAAESFVSQVSVAAPLQVSGGTDSPQISLPKASSTQNGYLSKEDWQTFNSKLSTDTALSGDVSGTAGAATVNKLKGVSLNFTSLSANQVLKFNGTEWVNGNFDSSDIVGLDSYLTYADIPTCSSAGTTLNYISATDSFECTPIAIDGSKVTGNISGTSLGFTGSLAGDVSGTQTNTSVDKIKGVDVDGTAPTSGQVLRFDGNKWVASDLNFHNGTVTNIETGTGLTGGPITTTGTISLASSGVTPGKYGTSSKIPTITVDEFGRVTNVELTPLIDTNPAGADLDAGKLWVGNSSDQATPVAPSGDITMSDAGNFKVTGIQGVPVSASAPSLQGQVLRYNGAQWEPGFVSMADLRSTVGGLSALTSSCDVNQTLSWTSTTDSLTCVDISLPVAQVTGTVSVAKGGTGTTTLTQNGVLLGNGTSAITAIDPSAEGLVLTSNGPGSAPSWKAPPGVISVTAGDGLTGGTITSTGTIALANSGVNAGTYGSTSAIPRITVDSYGRVTNAESLDAIINLTQVTGVLPVENGGTGISTSPTQYGVAYASSTTELATTAAGTAGYPLIANSDAAPSFQALNLGGSGVTGTLPVSKGGTGLTSITAYGLLMGNASGGITAIAPGAAGYVLMSNGGGTAPSWVPASTAYSDERFKKNITPIENSLEKIMAIRGVTYDWKRDEFPERNFSERNEIGVIAQEVEKQFPQSVETGEDGFKSVNYMSLIAPLINAVKELYAHLMDAQEEVTHQKREIASIQNICADKADLDDAIRLKEENRRLQEENEEIKARLERLERLMEESGL